MQNKTVKLALAIALLGLGGNSVVHATDDYNLLALQQQDQGLNPTPKKVGGLVAIAKDNPAITAVGAVVTVAALGGGLWFAVKTKKENDNKKKLQATIKATEALGQIPANDKTFEANIAKFQKAVSEYVKTLNETDRTLLSDIVDEDTFYSGNSEEVVKFFKNKVTDANAKKAFDGFFSRLPNIGTVELSLAFKDKESAEGIVKCLGTHKDTLKDAMQEALKKEKTSTGGEGGENQKNKGAGESNEETGGQNDAPRENQGAESGVATTPQSFSSDSSTSAILTPDSAADNTATTNSTGKKNA